MTSETETLKTNEFLRRRKLRLQQVREQSKDIAKKIRQRAKVEGLRQVVDLDVKKQKEYFDRQEKLVERLEVLYSKGLNNLGAGHQSAFELNQQGEINKTDLSKLRGKEAAAELRKKRQEKLDQQKKLLDRRLQAREAANELSREKSSVITNKQSQKPSQSADDKVLKSTPSDVEVVKDTNQVEAKNKDEQETVLKNDMATQWDVETIPNEWDPAVPRLKLATDDQDKPDDNIDSKTEKKLDLFALSEEMPSDLRGRHTDLSEVRSSIRPSLTLVTEYLQSRQLHLRESEIPHTKKSEDMSSIKKTIQRTRVKEGTLLNACHVLDEQVIPVPSWHAENACHFCAHCMTTNRDQPVTNFQMNRIFRCNRPSNLDKMSGIMPRPTLRSTSPYRRNKTCQQPVGKGTTNTKPDRNKNSVLMYNHNTRDIRDLPCSDEHLVVRNIQSSEDAYSLAMKESESTHTVDKDHKKAQDMRTRVAVTKQAVEKEYKDTINFLNSIPKDGNKVTKVAYMNDRRQQMVNESRQHKMQQEYRKIEKECRRHHTCLNRNKSKSPLKNEDEFERRDFQYSWMPVPEGDGNLAVHTIPNTVKEGKSGNTVKFSKVDSYHEYRSRHKHTPPTKDTSEKKSNKKYIKTVIDKNSSQSSEESSNVSNTSSVENLALNKDEQEKSKDQSSSDAERIIIYKILDTKNKHCKRKNKLLSNIAKSLSSIEKVQKPIDNTSESNNLLHKRTPITKTVSNTVSFEQINEGVYKIAEEGDNIISMQNANQESCKMATATGQVDHTCPCKRRALNVDKGLGPQWQDADNTPSKRILESCQCASTSKVKDATPTPAKKVEAVPTKQLSPRTSTSSFRTAVNDKSATTEAGYIKLVDEAGHEAGKFYLDPEGFLKDNAYEVVIQLRKKSDGNENNLLSKPKISKETKSSEEVIFVNPESDTSTPIPSNVEVKEQARSEDDIESKIITPPISTEQVSDNNMSVTDNKEEKAILNSDLISNNDIRIMPPVEEKKDVTENATNVIESEPPMPKLPSRPATTTYTQTTNSPSHRPIYFHMSSSTSTAYMSPPEMILPRFLKHDYVMTEDEVCGLESIETAPDAKCRKKCKHARKSRSDINLKRRDYNKNSTPPNTARSMLINDLHDTCKVPRIDALCKKSKTDKTTCKCYNCDIHNPIKDQVKKQCTKSKAASIVSKQMSRNLNMLTKDNVTSKSKTKRAGSYTKKDSLNLIIRNYVNRLLALNRQGLKAIEVAEQECSSVGTPGSSIIDVPFNIDDRKPSIGNKISLEQVKKALLQQIVNENLKSNLHRDSESQSQKRENSRSLCPISNKQSNYLPRKARKKLVHKVKSLNISKHLLKPNKKEESKRTKLVSLSTTTDDNSKTFGASKPRPRTSPLSRQANVAKPPSAKNFTKIGLNKNDNAPKFSNKESSSKRVNSPHRKDNRPTKDRIHIKLHKSTFTDTLQDSELSKDSYDYYKNKADIPISMSTQTSQNIDSDFVKLAEDKLLNMEKIADLTEKCTKRLSNLAKALEEVRKNKSSAYSAISTSDSADSYSDLKAGNEVKTPVQTDSIDISTNLEIKSLTPVPPKENISGTAKANAHSVFIPLLSDIPKTGVFQLLQPNINDAVPINTVTNVIRSLPSSPVSTEKSISEITKCKPKPPPALSRIHLKHGQEQVVPHELSTVLEVDSPLSVKNKNQSSHTELPSYDNKSPSKTKKTEIYFKKNGISKTIKPTDDSHLVHSKLEIPKSKLSSTDSSDDSKFQMIDLKQFNEIMLEPFISIHEYAKKYNIDVPDEGSNMEDLQRDEAINDDISSLHSDGSLPDVIAELLKRNVITEPFKFDTGSNVNSNTISSESTLSMLTLSKSRKVKRRSNVMFQNKENIGETSDTMSVSSNPDLENAFKKLGMGWASSTLKKTKERLALSSSSNTSSSSLQQFRLKSFNQDIPALVTDSVSSVLLSKKGSVRKSNDESSKNVEQQTSFANSMIVKEFLQNELANKITFTSNRSGINDTEDEFVSLYETKMPEGMKQQTLVNRDEQSNDSVPSGMNRARTSTPVQLFKSITYHSSSSSNLSNGLFSNADDLSSVKITSNSIKNHSTSDKDDLTIPNFSLKLKKTSDCSKSD